MGVDATKTYSRDSLIFILDGIPITGWTQISFSRQSAAFESARAVDAVVYTFSGDNRMQATISIHPETDGFKRLHDLSVTQQLAAVSVTGLVPASVLFEDPTNGHTVADEYAIVMTPPLPNFGERSEPVDVVIEMPNAAGSALLKLATAISA